MAEPSATFATLLAATIERSLEHDQLTRRISVDGVRSDHDPDYGPEAEAETMAASARRSELHAELAALFSRLEREHGAAWHAFLADAKARLTRIGDSGADDRYEAQGALYEWPLVERFGAGMCVLERHR